MKKESRCAGGMEVHEFEYTLPAPLVPAWSFINQYRNPKSNVHPIAKFKVTAVAGHIFSYVLFCSVPLFLFQSG